MLQLTNVTVTSPSKVILDQLSLTVSAGEAVGIVGESGSGKTTILKLLLGLPLNDLVFTEGSISYRDQPINPQKKRVSYSFVGTEVAWISQQSSLAFNNNRKIKHHYEDLVKSHQSRVDEMRSLEDCLQMVGLDQLQIPSKYPLELSGGMMQRVAIALALASHPKFLLADEPTSALDVLSKESLIETLKKLRLTDHLTLLFVTHDMSVAKELADRVLVMKEGKIVEEGSRDHIFQNPQHSYTQKLLRAIPKLKL
ncbi:ABC transporter ATP-binding protein [Streptococcus parasanguinis]|jgi:ABC-type dipeptide/oligopeptide/nickel transport system, ATPase component, putative|uniref:ATP-binding cassette domain-containing protein n=1 Tax=Streptococcus parasanguinis TaxID=1318 RepID=UPI0012BCCE8B|nr:ABC transporter ATP-binding protein [Streptococcus parasanguinis]MBZ1355896.1 ABC transporter ATP-binding protein [Streptococcus sp. LPB0406]MTS06301.1 ATP-binding cassette domain-containing protein [Streptococcus parasanguinis]